MGTEDPEKYLQFNLTEQSEFSIDLPIDLFSDVDLLVDPNENLKYTIINNSNNQNFLNNKNELLEFDALNLRFNGDTTDLGIDSLNGLKQYDLKLKVEDNYGYSDSIDFIFSLQRQLNSINVDKVSNQFFIDEGQSINLSDFFNIEHDDVPGEIIKLYIKENQSNQTLIIKDNNNVISKNSDNFIKGDWMFEGDLKSIKQSLTNISIKTTNQFAKGLVDFKIKFVNYLGNTGLEKETEFFELNYFLNPKPSLPEININSSLISQMDGFSLQPLSNVGDTYALFKA